MFSGAKKGEVQDVVKCRKGGGAGCCQVQKRGRCRMLSVQKKGEMQDVVKCRKGGGVGCCTAKKGEVQDVVAVLLNFASRSSYNYKNHQFSASAVELEFLRSERRLRSGRHYCIKCCVLSF